MAHRAKILVSDDLAEEGLKLLQAHPALDVTSKVLGIVGLGNIGKILADRARGLKMRVLAFDPFLTDEVAEKMGVEKVSLEELFPKADFISVHTPLTDQTRGLIGKDAFAKMK